MLPTQATRSAGIAILKIPMQRLNPCDIAILISSPKDYQNDEKTNLPYLYVQTLKVGMILLRYNSPLGLPLSL